MKVATYSSTSRYPLQFARLHPGSLFKLHAEVSRGLKFSKNLTVYRRAREEEGFYAYEANDHSKAIILMPEDLVTPLRQNRT